MYADDTAILSRHRNLDTLVENINEHLAHLETWFSVWKIALNSSKTEAVFFSKRKPPLKLLYKIKRIPWSQHTKYLGVIVDKNLTFRQHITYIRDKFKNTTRKLYSLICRKSKLNRHNKLLIYTLIMKPLLTYASPVWGHAAKTNINLLETAQNLIRRVIHQVKIDPKISAPKIAASISNTLGRSVSAETVRRVLRKADYNGRVARKKPLIGKRNRVKRLKFAKEHILKPQQFWNKVIFSDESKFNIFGSDGRRMV
ncbi:RNA-directed DNA polymerase from mobile element jockey [Trichonephila clavipes]|nr:RNA-directed DNA polymerase from mobile element jockey [Trichonephila clavipes]